MLHIYVLPLKKVEEILSPFLVFHNDAWFNLNCQSKINFKDKICVRLMQQIDNVQYIEGCICKTREGNQFTVDNLSTGCKTILSILSCPDLCFNISECGSNVIDYIFKIFTKERIGNILVTEFFVLPLNIALNGIIIHTKDFWQDGVKVKTRDELNTLIKKGLGIDEDGGKLGIF